MRYPVVALRGLVVLPKMLVHFDISRERSVAAVRQAMVQNQKVLLVMQKNENNEEPGQEDLYRYGTVCTVKQLMRMPNQVIRTLVEGEERAELQVLTQEDPYLEAEAELIPVEVSDDMPF